MKWLLLLPCYLLPFVLQAQPKTDYKKMGASLPPFVIQKADGTSFNEQSLQKGKAVMVMIFSPQCDHCEHYIDSMKALIPMLKNTQVVFVTEARNKDGLKDFVQKKSLQKIPAFRQAGYDKGNLIYFIYTYQLLPQINLYDTRHKLVKTFTGNFPMDSLQLYIK